LISGIFLSGPPGEILAAWHHYKIQFVFSVEIFIEYICVGQKLAERHPEADVGPILALVILHGEQVAAPPLDEQVCIDSQDDKFFACALAANCSIIISGDKHLQCASGYKGIVVLSPRQFVDKHLAH